jgi:hypothetical protein
VRSRNDLGDAAALVLDDHAHHVVCAERQDRSSGGADSSVLGREPDEVAIGIRSVGLLRLISTTL